VTEERPTEVELGDPPPGEKRRERWLVPFLVVPLSIALTLLAIVGFANFLLGRFEPGSIDRHLETIQTGGSNARKQAAFHLARDLVDLVERSNRELRDGKPGGGAASRGVLDRATLAKIERAYERARGELETRHYFIESLGLVGDEKTAEFLERQIESPDEPDDGNFRRVWILMALARIGSPSSRALYDAELQRVSSTAPDRGVANVLAAAFGNLPGPDATKGLRQLLALSRARGWKLEAMSAAVNLAKRHEVDPEAAQDTIPALLESLDVIHQDAFADRERLFRGGEQAGFPFANATQQADAYRETAAVQVIEALVLLKVNQALPLLEKIAKDDPNFRIQSAALGAIKALR
jgi:HEAT repeat protein